MLEEVRQWLNFYGCSVESGNDIWMLKHIISTVEQYIKNYCNISKIPERLYYLVINMCAGEFLKRKKATGTLEGFNLEAAVKSISEGDTSVSFKDSSLSDEERLNALIESLTSGNRVELNKYRRFAW